MPVSLPNPDVVDPSPADQARWFARDIQPHEPALRSWLGRRFPMLPDVDDIVQETYVRMLRAKASGRMGRAKAYLFTTARNFAFDLFRRKRVVSIEGVTDLDALSVLEEGPGVPESASRRQDLELLAEAVRRLPDRCRQVMILRFLHEMAHKEIAAELRISEHTVKAQLAKGMRRCAKFFEVHGDCPSAPPVAEDVMS